jgi:fucose permease
MRRLQGRKVMGFSLAAMALGAVDAALAHQWWVFLLGVFVIGVGFGGLDFSMNALLARTALQGRAHRLSFANAGYGVGAVVGPLLIIALHPNNFPILFAAVAVIAIVLSSLNRGVVAPPLSTQIRRHETDSHNAQRRSILIIFIVAYVLYVATESSASGWIASQLHQEGSSTSIGSLVTGGFWMGLALGRTFGGALYKVVSDKVLVLGGLSFGAILGVAASSHHLAAYAYPVMGLSLASVYPMGLIWYTVLCPHDSDGLALIILFMMAGGVLGPGGESLMVSLVGIHVVPYVVAAFAALDVGAFSLALRFKPVPQGAAPAVLSSRPE